MFYFKIDLMSNVRLLRCHFFLLSVLARPLHLSFAPKMILQTVFVSVIVLALRFVSSIVLRWVFFRLFPLDACDCILSAPF